jgi:hypothetical protein
MPIEMPCTGCGQTLRVAEEHAGKMARCPQCGTIARVPGPGDAVGDPFGQAQSPSSPGEAEAAWDTKSTGNPFGENPYSSPGGFQPGPVAGASPSRYQRPHRGGAVLTLGIIGVFCCVIPGIVAWAMGASDLKQMRAGNMDPSGRGLTQAGMILGIVSVVLNAAWIALNVLAALAGGF